MLWKGASVAVSVYLVVVCVIFFGWAFIVSLSFGNFELLLPGITFHTLSCFNCSFSPFKLLIVIRSVSTHSFMTQLPRL